MNNFPKSEQAQGGWGKAKVLEEDEDEDEEEERGRIHAGRFSASRRAISANVAAKTTIVNSSTVLILILILIFILFQNLRFAPTTLGLLRFREVIAGLMLTACSAASAP